MNRIMAATVTVNQNRKVIMMKARASPILVGTREYIRTLGQAFDEFDGQPVEDKK